MSYAHLFFIGKNNEMMRRLAEQALREANFTALKYAIIASATLEQ